MRRSGSNSLVSVRSFPQLVRRHPGREVVVLHHILEVELRHHLKLKKKKSEVLQDVHCSDETKDMPHTSGYLHH